MSAAFLIFIVVGLGIVIHSWYRVGQIYYQPDEAKEHFWSTANIDAMFDQGEYIAWRNYVINAWARALIYTLAAIAIIVIFHT